MANIAGNVASLEPVEMTRDATGLCESQITGAVEAYEGNQPPETGTAIRAVPALVRTTP